MANRIVTVVVVGFMVAGGFYSVLPAQAMRTVWDGVYTRDQAKRGAALFERECA